MVPILWFREVFDALGEPREGHMRHMDRGELEDTFCDPRANFLFVFGSGWNDSVGVNPIEKQLKKLCSSTDRWTYQSNGG